MSLKNQYKTINPDTGEFWKTHDVREDGYIFSHYRSIKGKKSGMYRMHFYAPKTIVNNTRQKKLRDKKRRETINKNPYPKRLNPKTQKPFIHGEMENGLYFLEYAHNVELTKLRGERWKTPKDFLAYKMNQKLYKIKKYDTPNTDLDLDYLKKIYPKNKMCPICRTKIKLDHSSGISNSPSLDRIDCKGAYVKDNVVWVSHRGNVLKGDLTLSDVDALLKFYKPLIKNGYHPKKNKIKFTKREKVFFTNMRARARGRAIRDNREFNLTRKFLIDIFPNDRKCPITNMDLEFGTTDGYTNSPSLDRINNDLGYVEGNIVIVSNFINKKKHANTIETLKRIKKIIKATMFQ